MNKWKTAPQWNQTTPPKWGEITLLDTFGSKEEIKPSLVRNSNPGHGSFERWPRTPSPFLWGEDVVTPQEVLLPREVLVKATLGDHPEMVQSAWVDVLCREVCGIQGRVAWGLHKSQHSCRRTSAEQLTWGHISTNLLPNRGNHKEGARRSSRATCSKWAGLGAPRSRWGDWSSCLSWPWEPARCQEGRKRESQQDYWKK